MTQRTAALKKPVRSTKRRRTVTPPPMFDSSITDAAPEARMAFLRRVEVSTRRDRQNKP